MTQPSVTRLSTAPALPRLALPRIACGEAFASRFVGTAAVGGLALRPALAAALRPPTGEESGVLLGPACEDRVPAPTSLLLLRGAGSAIPASDRTPSSWLLPLVGTPSSPWLSRPAASGRGGLTSELELSPGPDPWVRSRAAGVFPCNAVRPTTKACRLPGTVPPLCCCPAPAVAVVAPSVVLDFTPRPGPSPAGLLSGAPTAPSCCAWAVGGTRRCVGDAPFAWAGSVPSRWVGRRSGGPDELGKAMVKENAPDKSQVSGACLLRVVSHLSVLNSPF